MPRNLAVYLNGTRVGTLTHAARVLQFVYATSWITSSVSRPLSLSMPLRREPYSGDVVENYFDNLLPDNQAIRNRIQTRFGSPSNRAFDLLWHTGRDCVGAVQLIPDGAEAVDVRRVEATPVSDVKIAAILNNYRTMPLGMRPDIDFRISLAGAQEKTALLRLDGRWCIPSGVTPTSHILKLPIGTIAHSGMDLTDSVENEWLCHLILKEFGVPVANAEMEVFEGVKALVVERFDRRWAEDGSWLIRLPQEDMCQAMGVAPALKYESDGGPGIQKIMTFLLGSADALGDRRVFMQVQVLFWLLAAIDGHAKNFSIFIRPRGEFSLTPMYDVLSAYPLVVKGQLDPHRLRMAMAVSGKNRRYEHISIRYRHWLATAQRNNVSPEEMALIIEELLDRVDSITAAVASRLPHNFPGDVAESIFEGMRQSRDRLASQKHER
ncbi:transcriptional regulator HipA [Geotalea daltonii FRC-32]|uniref:Transcriptional regulator HipA n=1 Tax=Geotalea daltonii (strain DSM 22248 / JCM 15807 / FRC-32) TaxID=316067 RepID=B9M8C4_GEODF|nr:type II toxin-antitoxin system HipA family toxin [Geotalea daltonii]ACM18459.1 transcriptional regulator HipA [Geotalea daltonii FRC-32]